MKTHGIIGKKHNAYKGNRDIEITVMNGEDAMSPEQKKYYCELLEHAPEKLLEDLAWLYDTRNVAIQRHSHALRERERWHGKYMMVKHENNQLRRMVGPLIMAGDCPHCGEFQQPYKNKHNKYRCPKCGGKYKLHIEKDMMGDYFAYTTVPL